MLSELINFAKNQLGDKVTQNTPLNQQQSEEAIEIGGHSIFDGLKNEAMSGNLPQLFSLFSGNLDMNSAMNNPIVQGIARNFVSNVVSRLGVSPEIATSIVNFILPLLFSTVKQQAMQNPQMMTQMMGSMGMPGTSQTNNNQSFAGETMSDIQDILGGFFKK